MASRQTHRAVVKQIEQGNEEGASVLAVPANHGVKMGAKGSVGVLVAKAPNYRAFGSLDRLLHLVRHLQPCHSLHLWEEGVAKNMC